ncbi:hypothetical protein C882_0378 [Caenispirillum salinarum AK4]|uniref:Uncharacterized protein n=1 Tax=Caenispirillum salinarum AK4 TaxID=1238182 RepID=K9HLY0_9PROT|nr:hypothetical protein C882_0378 [Caenispirillum salinarum AK4]
MRTRADRRDVRHGPVERSLHRVVIPFQRRKHAESLPFAGRRYHS